MSKRVAIIGSGACGLIAIKTCLEYGLDSVCYEKSHDIGGLWRYKPNDCEDEASVMKSTVINTSKEMMSFTDFPPPREFPNFMHNRKVMEYFRMYAAHFDLLPAIHFQTEVLSVKKSENFTETGEWLVTVLEKVSGRISEQRFSAVFLCTGHHVDPYVPKLRNLGAYKGTVIHSHDYKDHVGFEDKRVIVIGVGNSGGDISVELSRICSQVYLVTRRGTWVLNRISDYGLPIDIVYGSWFTQLTKYVWPAAANWITESQLNERFDHTMYGLKPAHRVWQQHPTVNDDLPNRIACGTIIVKSNICEFTETGAIFEDGTEASNIDVVIFATGYSFGFPYLQQDLIPVDENHVSLYKYMIPPLLPHQTLFVIGLFQPIGALNPIAEMQCRVAAEILSGRITVPGRTEMLEDIKAKQLSINKRYIKSRRHTIQVDYAPFMFELAKMIRAGVSWTNYLFSDPSLAWALLFGPCLPYQFRLNGYNTWPEARETILSVWDRITYPTLSKKQPSGKRYLDTMHKYVPYLHLKGIGFMLSAIIFFLVMIFFI